MIEIPTWWYIQIMGRSSPLTILLAACLGCAVDGGDEPLDCAAAPTVAGSATFEGQTYVFDDADAVIHMSGTAEDPCIHSIEVEAEGAPVSLRVLVHGTEDLYSVQFHRSVTYGAYDGELQYFNVSFEIEEQNEDCARASFDIEAEEVRLGQDLDGAMQGAHYLTDLDLSVSGTWTIEWVDWEC
jgi:hypothetical protein